MSNPTVKVQGHKVITNVPSSQCTDLLELTFLNMSFLLPEDEEYTFYEFANLIEKTYKGDARINETVQMLRSFKLEK